MNTHVRPSSSRTSLALALTLCPLATGLLAEAATAQRRPTPRAPGPAFRPAPAARPTPRSPRPQAAPATRGLNLPRNAQTVRWGGTPPPAAAIAAATRRTAESGAMANCSPAAARAVALTLVNFPATKAAKKEARESARKFFTEVIPAKKTRPGVRKVTRLKWHKTLAKATQAAAKAKKPVLWIQALGDLKGYT